VLPKGKWYDFYSGKFVGDGEIITASGLDRIPAFVKDGAIIRWHPIRIRALMLLKKLTLRYATTELKPEATAFMTTMVLRSIMKNGAYAWREIVVFKEEGWNVDRNNIKSREGKAGFLWESSLAFHDNNQVAIMANTSLKRNITEKEFDNGYWYADENKAVR
jgi:alpha-D-xyloside xylohydrolase